jgi:hypothetical protein
VRWLVLCLALAGCDKLLAARSALAPGAPVVQADSGGTATLTLIGCPRTVQGGEIMQQVLTMLVNYQQPIVVAKDGATARLTINACPSGFGEAIAAQPPQRQR